MPNNYQIDTSPLKPVLLNLKEGLLSIIQWKYLPLAVLLILYVLFNGYLTFFSEYKNYIFSDMDAYFNHAISIYNGNAKSIGNWVGFSPFYSRVLAESYAILILFNIDEYFLEYVLCQNILLSALSGISLYYIGYKTSKKRWVALTLTGLYLFSYAHLYFNAFVLSEPFAVPLIIISVSLLFHWQKSYKVIFIAILLGIAVGVRPSNGLLGLPFALYIWLNDLHFSKATIKDWIKHLWPSTLKAAAFSLAFFATLLVITAENNRISDGRMKSLTSNSGYNFLMGQSQAHRIFSHWDGLTFVFSASSVAHHPEQGSLHSKIPLYDSDAYYKEGWKILQAYPNLWAEHFVKYKFIFFDNLFPAVGQHIGFAFMDVFRYILFYMLLLCSLTYITLKENDISKSVMYFFYAAFFLPAAALYFFTVTHKYFFNFSYAMYILFTFGLYSSIKHWQKYKRFISYYLLTLIVGTIAFWCYVFFSKVYIEHNLVAVISENNYPIKNLDSPRQIKRSESIFINELAFYEHNQLQHSTLDLLNYRTNFFMDVKSEMTILEDGTYTFTIFGDDGFRVSIDGKQIIYSHGPKSMADSEQKRSIRLTKGKHLLEIKMYQTRWASGLAGYYQREESRVRHPGVIWEPMGGRGLPIGRDDEFTRFNALESSEKYSEL